MYFLSPSYFTIGERLQPIFISYGNNSYYSLWRGGDPGGHCPARFSNTDNQFTTIHKTRYDMKLYEINVRLTQTSVLKVNAKNEIEARNKALKLANWHHWEGRTAQYEAQEVWEIDGNKAIKRL